MKMTDSLVIASRGIFKVIDTREPNANIMNDVRRPYAVCKAVGSIGRVAVCGRYADTKQAVRRMNDLARFEEKRA